MICENYLNIQFFQVLLGIVNIKILWFKFVYQYRLQ